MTPTVEEPDERVFCVRTLENQETIRVRAETVCEEGGFSKGMGSYTLTFKLKGNVVGRIRSTEPINWWIEEQERK